MVPKTKRSTDEVPYCFSRSSIKFQGHTGGKNDDLNPICDYKAGRSYHIPQMLPCLLDRNFCLTPKSLRLRVSKKEDEVIMRKGNMVIKS